MGQSLTKSRRPRMTSCGYNWTADGTDTRLPGTLPMLMAAVLAAWDTASVAGSATENCSLCLLTRPVPHHHADIAQSFVETSAVQAMNLLDPYSIEAYLDGFLPSDPAAAGLLRLALGKVL